MSVFSAARGMIHIALRDPPDYLEPALHIPFPSRGEIQALRRDLKRQIKPKRKRPYKGSKAAKRASRSKP